MENKNIWSNKKGHIIVWDIQVSKYIVKNKMCKEMCFPLILKTIIS